MRHSSLALSGASSAPPLTPKDVEDVVRWARELTGMTLDPRKPEFLSARLGRRLAARGLAEYGDYRRLLRDDPAERTAFAEALTIHTTSFFREKAQYDWLLRDGLPALSDGGRGGNITIWSAACSTGQEGWSALITAMQARDRGVVRLDAQLLGTDLSRQVLRVASSAIYPRTDVEGIPADLRPRVLLSSRNGDGRCRIVPALRERAAWRQANLATGAGLDGVAADVAFLRNVLIYFDAEIRNRVMDNVVRRLRPGGFLLVGHTEAAHARREGLELVRPSILRKL